MLQTPGVCQIAASNISGFPSNRVTVKTRRTGGGFGGKLTRQIPVTAAAALGAVVTGRQVHVQMERVQDLAAVCVVLC